VLFSTFLSFQEVIPVKEGVCIEFRHEVSTDFGICKLSKSTGFRLENPVPVLFGVPVPIHNPFVSFLMMSAFCPLPERVPEIEIHLSECLFCDNMAVILCPTGNHGVERLN
jgi:hypothetical protein